MTNAEQPGRALQEAAIHNGPDGRPGAGQVWQGCITRRLFSLTSTQQLLATVIREYRVAQISDRFWANRSAVWSELACWCGVKLDLNG